MESNHMFSDNSIQLLQHSATLDPKIANDPFRIGDICQVVENFYLEDSNEQEKVLLKMQLQHY